MAAVVMMVTRSPLPPLGSTLARLHKGRPSIRLVGVGFFGFCLLHGTMNAYSVSLRIWHARLKAKVTCYTKQTPPQPFFHLGEVESYTDDPLFCTAPALPPATDHALPEVLV